ncbi:ATP-binding protein [Streptomyces sp. NPDC052179]|uniref:ATP-binding protein n=1 Tax=Streptomyces sp. NPDC052179 TaxID=3155680 RepID=UPI00342C4834
MLPFEAEPVEVRRLRKAVRRQLLEWGLSAAADEAELAVSELATNVIKHVGRGMAATLVLESAAGRLRIELHDKSSRVPEFASLAGCDDECGRGLHLLAGMAAGWGTLLTAAGKAVWCEFVAVPESHCRRLRRAESVLAQYGRESDGPQLPSRSDILLEESATDLISDILHWVAARGGDPDGFLDRAQMHFEADSEVLAEAV